MELNAKKVIITGAMGGIGLELTKTLAATGAELILVERSDAEFNKLPAELNDKVHKFSADFSKTEAVRSLAGEISNKFPTIDILINNAGIGVYKELKNITYDEWEKSFAINVHAPFILTRFLLPNLQAAETAIVFNIGSGAGVYPMIKRVTYCATKFALRGMSLSLSAEYKDTNLKFMLLTLGSTMTEFGPLTLGEKTELEQKGKNYLDPNIVAQKVVSLLKGNEYPSETTLYPENYSEEHSSHGSIA